MTLLTTQKFPHQAQFCHSEACPERSEGPREESLAQQPNAWKSRSFTSFRMTSPAPWRRATNGCPKERAYRGQLSDKNYFTGIQESPSKRPPIFVAASSHDAGFSKAHCWCQKSCPCPRAETTMDLALKTGVVLNLVGLSQRIDAMSQRPILTGIPFQVMA